MGSGTTWLKLRGATGGEWDEWAQVEAPQLASGTRGLKLRGATASEWVEWAQVEASKLAGRTKGLKLRRHNCKWDERAQQVKTPLESWRMSNGTRGSSQAQLASAGDPTWLRRAAAATRSASRRRRRSAAAPSRRSSRWKAESPSMAGVNAVRVERGKSKVAVADGSDESLRGADAWQPRFQGSRSSSRTR